MMYQFLDEFKTYSFNEACSKMTIQIEDTLYDYLKILNLKSIQEMDVFFALLEVDSNTVCAKKMVDVGGWRCVDCAKNNNIIFCQDCWSKMKDRHKDHNVVFISEVSGTCDCGDHNCIDRQYFCPKHKGTIERKEEINAYINRVLGEKLAQRIKEVNERMFNNMFNFFMKAMADKKTKEKAFNEVVNKFANCFGILCEMSSACNFIICDLLLKKYPNKTKHTCIDIEGKNGKMIKSSFFNHD